MEKKMRFAIIGCGFWSQFQLGAWTEIEGCECVALYNRTKSKAVALAQRFGVPRVYDDVDTLFSAESLDFVDIITDVDTHAAFVQKAVEAGVPHIICQKPLAPDYATAANMVAMCREKGVKLYVHENYRWQAPIRRLKALLDSGVVGNPFKARVSFLSAYPVFDNQPFLKELDHFILTDMGSHVLDVCRYLFGEMGRLWSKTLQVNPGIKGEDVAVAFMETVAGMPVYTEMSYASRLENDSFSTVWVLVECEKGSLSLGPDFTITITDAQGTRKEKVTFPSYEWADPDYIVNHESGIPLNRNLLNDMLGIEPAETSGADNLKTVELVWACYRSATEGGIVEL